MGEDDAKRQVRVLTTSDDLWRPGPDAFMAKGLRRARNFFSADPCPRRIRWHGLSHSERRIPERKGEAARPRRVRVVLVPKLQPARGHANAAQESQRRRDILHRG